MCAWTPNAADYDFGRPFPGELVCKLLVDSPSWKAAVPPDVKKRIFEPGCGTGRILIPLAAHYPHSLFFGGDSYEDALAECTKRARELKLTNIRLANVDLSELDPVQVFDAILHSSVLHAIPEWKSVLEKLTSILSASGLFVLIGDSGDVHAAALGRTISGEPDPALVNFWAEYRILREKFGLPDPESSQRGCRWDVESGEIFEKLEEKGFREVDRREIEWVQEYSIADLFGIVENRVYSSMFSVDEKTFAELTSELDRKFRASHAEMTQSRHRAVARFLQKF